MVARETNGIVSTRIELVTGPVGGPEEEEEETRIANLPGGSAWG